jgi:ribosomal protein L12E/L44/L45/RPP1/RPP2
MDLGVMFTDLKAHFEQAVAEGEKFLGEHLPALGHLADQAASNPLITSVLNAVHVSPEILTGMATVIDKLEADLAAAEAAKQAAESAAAAAGAPGAGVAPADPVAAG